MRYVILASLFLAGCASTVAHQASPMTVTQAQAVIEQVVMEQPPKHRPAAVVFTDAYIALSQGTVSNGRAVAVPVYGFAVANARSVSIERSTLLYFNTIADTRLHKKRDWYVLDVVDDEGRILQRVYCRDETKAHRFVDAIAALRS
jgi:hypothetical protein